MKRVLIVGGTGMLKGVVLELAAKGAHITLLSRNRTKMENLAGQMDNPSGRIHFIEADYRDTDTLRSKIGQNMHYFGPFDAVIGWIHSQGYHAHLEIAELTAHPDMHYYQVLGSMSRDPHAAPDKVAAQMEAKTMHYHQLVLGFIVENGNSRWLTNDEIREGIMEGIELNKPEHIIGVVEPWDARP